MSQRTFAVGDRVVKDPSGWIPSEFDAWGPGEGVGVVVDVLPGPDEGAVRYDVLWPAGRARQEGAELLPAGVDPAPSMAAYDLARTSPIAIANAMDAILRGRPAGTP